ncbi:NEK protein kinase [Aphanomyces invadans]|uniref:non-specific serine/threonine protein kinase n=1 Tax=Aphanomyces invadans TaxID=157072 RepID=A0A024TAH9_9STRA|nr:NEK protein kinase [Aphanomyces invadans]ETV90332.1 NEK protein kinase [Aphanomyces invadans]|eukprot:XP_008881059.1 NEK protein kinase [Aphanomyces invadans]
MDQYTRIRQLGEGSFGNVYLMREKREGGNLVCIKDIPIAPTSLKAKRGKSGANEAQLMKRLRHPNLIVYLDSFESRNHRHLFIVMEYCSGGDLHATLQGKRRLESEATVCLWLVQICLGLHSMHHRRIMHRDIKSHNIFISHDGHLVLGDLGMSRELDQDDLAHTTVGTPYFMSPELCDGDGTYSYASDVWAVGCVLYEMCTLHFPFEAKTTPALVKKICTGDYTPLDRKYSPHLRQLQDDLLAVNPTHRPTVQHILTSAFLRPALECYVSDVVKCGSKHHADELRTQLHELRLDAVWSHVHDQLKPARQSSHPPGTVTSIIPPNPLIPAHNYKLEDDMLQWLENERQRHLVLVLGRIKEARCSNNLSPRPAVPQTIVSPESPRRCPPPTPDPAWRPPVQSCAPPARHLSSAHRAKHSSATLPLGFRKGVHMTPNAKPYLAQACQDVRVLRRSVYAQAAHARTHIAAHMVLASSSPPKHDASASSADSIEDAAVASPDEIDAALLQYQRDVERRLRRQGGRQSTLD